MTYQARKDRRWWQEPKGADVHTQIAGIVRTLIDAGDSRRRYFKQWRALYCNERGVPPGAGYDRDRRHRFNVIAALVDAAQAKQVSQRPRPQILTTGGDNVQVAKAKGLTDWVSGQFEHLDLYEDVLEPAALDSKLVGTGIAKIYPKEGRPCVDLCYAEDIFIDPREQRNNCVRTLYHARSVDRWVLADEYPRHRGLIKNAPSSPLDEDESNVLIEMADLIMVIEAWRLPASKKTPGRHAVCIEGGTLRNVEYTKRKFPFRKLVWMPKPRSWFGRGIVEDSAGTQLELDTTTKVISDALNRCVPFVITPTNVKFNRQQLTNEPWAWYTCDAAPQNIQVHMPKPIQADFTMREDRLISRSFEQHRISQMSAEGKKPAGLNSGKALVVHNDVESMNHIVSNRAYERFAVEIGEALIECAEDLVREDEKKSERAGDDYESDLDLVALSGKNELQQIDFKDVRLSDQPTVMRAYPVASLAQSPQGRYEQLADMHQTGAIDIDEFRELLDNPDISGKNRRRFAARNLIDRMLDEALAHGKRSADLVSPYMDLQYAMKQAHLAYCEGIFHGVPESHQSAVEEICGAVKSEIAKLTPPPPAPAPMPPPGAGAPPPAQGVIPPPSMAPPGPIGPPG